MDRRTFVKLSAALALAQVNRAQASSKRLSVVVVGAGIIGASTAYHLAKAGARVTVIDKLGPASHASRGTFAWINATWAKQPRHYHQLNQESIASWHGLQQELGIPVRWSGSIEWFRGPQRQIKLAEQIEEQEAWGEPARMLDASEVAKLEPNLNFGGDELAAFSGNDGAVDPILATNMLLDAAKRYGAKVSYPCELQGVSVAQGSMVSVRTSRGNLQADKIVLATGAAVDLPKTMADIDIPQRSTPGVIALTEPMPRVIQRVIAAPGVHLHQRGDGRVVLGEQDGAPKNVAHAQRLAERPNNFPSAAIAQDHAQRMLSVAKTFVRGMSDAAIAEAYIGWRPLPLDGHPVLGFSPNKNGVYLAMMHSGVSLAPIVGQLAAVEVLEGTQLEALDRYRPDRKFELKKRY